jgi:hypothetical protein
VTVAPMGTLMRTVFRRLRVPAVLSLVAAAAAVGPAAAASYYLCTDVPATLGGTDFRPDQVLLSAGGTYSVQLDFAQPHTQVAGLERRTDGIWLLTPAQPEEGGVGPRDVITFDGVTPSMYFDGNANGVPEYARIDSVLLDAGSLVLSFDVPVNLGGIEYAPADLVRWNAPGFSLYWDAQLAGIPPGSNVVGAGLDPTHHLILSFDVPTNLGGTEYLPGQLVQWNGGTAFSSYAIDPGWPAAAQLRDFGFVPASGAVPGDQGLPATSLTVSRNPATGELTLSWGTSCLPGDTDYEIYEGTMGPMTTQGFYSHTEKLCSTSGLTSQTFPEPGGSAYYLVVPRNAAGEGSYGQASNLTERPVGVSACLPQALAGCP